MAKRNPIRLTYPSPGKHGEQEVRDFQTVEQAMAYLDRNSKNDPVMRDLRFMLEKAWKGE